MLKSKIVSTRNKFMKEHNRQASAMLSFILSEIKNIEIDTNKRDGLQDKDIIILLQKHIKKMQESRELFLKGNRYDLAEKEDYSIKLLNTFLPKLLNEEEIKKIVTEVLNNFNNPSIKDMGKIMAEFKDRYDIDKSVLSKIIKLKLQ